MSLTVLPVITFDSTGSDTAASGDGTVSAIFGSACNVTSSSATCTITDAVNLGSVPQDGSAVLWVNTASGRQFSRISVITGSVGSWTLTLEDTVWTTSTNKTWGIGGKRATIDNVNSRKLFTADIKAGWTASITSNMTTSSSTISLVAVGDTTTGPVIITGNADSGSQPVVTTSANVAIFTVPTGSRYVFRKLAFQCTSGTRTTAYGISGGTGTTFLLVDNCIFGDATNKLQAGIHVSGGILLTRVQDSEIKNCNGNGIEVTASSGQNLDIDNCKIHDNASAGISSVVALASFDCSDSTIYNNSSDGISLITAAITAEVCIERCTIHNNTGNGVNLGSVAHSGLTIVNNEITGNTSGYGVSTTNTALDKTKSLLDYNNYGTGGTANSSGALQNLTAGAHDLTVDPGYAGSPNFAVGTNVKAKGYPDATRTVGGNTGGTTTYQDIGAAQRVEPAGSAGLLLNPGLRGGLD